MNLLPCLIRERFRVRGVSLTPVDSDVFVAWIPPLSPRQITKGESQEEQSLTATP